MKTKFGRAYIGNHGYYVITSQKEGNHNKLLHRLIYEEAHGKIPDGYHVHHKDGNKLNNSIDNLELLEKREHHSLHSTNRHGKKRKFSFGNRNTLKPYLDVDEDIKNDEGIPEFHKIHSIAVDHARYLIRDDDGFDDDV